MSETQFESKEDEILSIESSDEVFDGLPNSDLPHPEGEDIAPDELEGIRQEAVGAADAPVAGDILEKAAGNATPIQKIIKYIQSPVKEDIGQIFTSLEELAESLVSIGKEVHSVNTILNETERLRLRVLQNEYKLGLQDEQLPYGKRRRENIVPIGLVYESATDANEYLRGFSKNLELLGSSAVDTTSANLELLQETIAMFNEITSMNLSPRDYVLNGAQANGYYKIAHRDDTRVMRFEIDVITNFIKSSVEANAKVLSKREEFYKSLLHDVELDFPDISPLLKDVTKLKSLLSVKLEELPALLNSEEKEHLSKFLPALDEFYKDQIAAFSGGVSFIPLSRDLAELQSEIDTDRSATNILHKSEILGYSMQRLYVLHWIAENLMKTKYKNTLGMAIKEHLKRHPEKESKYAGLQQAVKFRNDIAHNGLIWKPNDFERHVKAYADGIQLMAREFNVELDSFVPKRQDKPLSKKEIENRKKLFFERLQIDRDILAKLDASFVKDIDTKSMSYVENSHKERIDRLLQISDKLRAEHKISLARAYEIDQRTIVNAYRNRGQPIEFKFININAKNLFAEKYFRMKFDDAVTILSQKNKNRNHEQHSKTMFYYAMREKEGTLTKDDYQKIKQLQEVINDR